MCPEATLAELLRISLAIQQLKPRVTAQPTTWQAAFPAKLVSTGGLDGSLGHNCLIWYECVMVIGALFMT